MSEDAFYVPDGSTFVATEWTRGPWSPLFQHGGPPSALLARAVVAKLAEVADSLVMRLTIDFSKPVPVGPVEVAPVTVLRAGRKVQELAAELRVGGEPVVTMRALCIRRTELPIAPPTAEGLPRPRPPEACAPYTFPFFRERIAYAHAFDGRVASGVYGSGAMAMWMRPRFPLVLGEAALDPIARVALVADSGHGVSVAVPFDEYTFVNPDVTVAVARPAEGAWLCLDAGTQFGPHGAGLSSTVLWDERGELGRVLQTLVLEKR